MRSLRLAVLSLSCVVAALSTGCEPTPTATPLSPSIRLENAGPSNARAVLVLGSAPSGASIEVFADGQCAGLPLVTATSDELARGVRVEAAANATTFFSARATLNGVFSACSAPAVYVHDDVAPAVPSLVAVQGLGDLPPTVKITGMADPDVRVRVFTDATCTTLGKEVRAMNGAFEVELGVQPNAETLFTAQALDAAGNASACSGSLRFVHDLQAPVAPRFTSVVPAGPSKVAVPTVAGDAEAGSSVRFFFDASCAGSPAGTTTADASGHFTTQVAMQLNTVNRLYALALDASGNRSACSTPLLYEHDDTPPQVFFNGTTPGSPSRTATSFTVNVSSSENGATLALYATADCSGAAVGSVFTVTPNTPVTVSARATDVAGNVSDCVAGPTLLNDTVAPGAPSITNSMPASPSRTSQNPVLVGTADANGALRLFRTADCTGSASSYTVASSGQFSASTSVTANASTTFTANVTDVAGNVSGCSAPFVFTHDNRAPAAATVWGTLPPSPSVTTGPVRVTGAAETGAQVQVFTSSGCVGMPAATVTAGAAINTSGAGTFSAPVTVTAGATTTLSVLVVDAAGNASPCSAALTFVQAATRGWADDVSLGFSTGRHAFPEVALTPAGDAVAVFGRLDVAPMGVFRSERVNGAWTAPALLTDPADTLPYMTNAPRVVSDASGVVLAGWTAHQVSGLARRAADGSWTTQALGASDYGRTPDVALDGSGNGVAAIERFVTSTVRVFARRSTGAAWGAEALISDPAYSCFEPHVAEAPGGRALIAFSRNTGSGTSPHDELWSTTGEAATAFPAATQRSSPSALFDRRDVRVGMSGTGEATAVWLQSSQNLGPWTLTAATTTSGVWGAASTLSSTTTSQREFEVQELASGEAMAVWRLNGASLQFSRRLAGGAWGVATALTGTVYPAQVRLASDSSGRFFAVWNTVDAYGGGGQLWFSVFTANAWSAPQLIDVGVGAGDRFSVALDATGRAVVAWSKVVGADTLLRTRSLQ